MCRAVINMFWDTCHPLVCLHHRAGYGMCQVWIRPEPAVPTRQLVSNRQYHDRHFNRARFDSNCATSIKAPLSIREIYVYLYIYIYIYTFMYRGEALCVPSHCVGTCACWEMKSLRSMSVVRSSMSYRQNLSMPLAAMLCNECGLTEVHRSFALKTLLRWNDISQRMPHAAIPDWCKYERNAPSVCPFQTFRKIAMDVNSWTMQL